jgi:4'-phosphopantetheinyl transferase
VPATWAEPPVDVAEALGPDDVHVWRADLDVDDAARDVLWSLLSDDEQARARRFHFRRDRCRFITGRGMLRTILSRYARIAPALLRFTYNASGKPALDHLGLHFNLSHSHGAALCALTREREIGVDIELISSIDHVATAQRFFAPREWDVLRRLPADALSAAFCDCWVRKEAYIKAIGAGLSLPLDAFVVSCAPGEPAALLDVDAARGPRSGYALVALDAGPRYRAAIAVDGAIRELRGFNWNARSCGF